MLKEKIKILEKSFQVIYLNGNIFLKNRRIKDGYKFKKGRSGIA